MCHVNSIEQYKLVQYKDYIYFKGSNLHLDKQTLSKWNKYCQKQLAYFGLRRLSHTLHPKWSTHQALFNAYTVSPGITWLQE